MTTTPISARREASAAQESAPRRILVWDAPVRVFHWLLALCFAGAWLTSEGDALRPVHIVLGYTTGGLVAFRLVWGLLGSRHSRFGDFVRGPGAVARYLRSLVSGKPEHYVGHNPAGALAIVALLGLAAVLVATGWATNAGVAGKAMEEVHEAIATAMLVLVGVHVAAVAASSWLHRENLVGAMLHGYKRGAPREGIARPWRGVAALLLAAVLAFWWIEWRDPPAVHADGHAATAAQEDDD